MVNGGNHFSELICEGSESRHLERKVFKVVRDFCILTH